MVGVRSLSRAGLVLVLAAVAACSLLKSFDGFEGAGADAAADVSDAGETDDGRCKLLKWPGPPPADTEGPSEPETTSALDGVTVTEQIRDGVGVGYDLDGLCTCPEKPACRGSKPGLPCDGTDSGLDNATASLFLRFVEQGVGIDDTGLKSALLAGQFGILLRLRDYNGRPNDPKVSLEVFNAVAANRPPRDAGADAAGPFDPGPGAKLDGNDTWIIDSDSYLDDRFPTFFSSGAYVRDGVLVAELTNLVLRLRFPAGPTTWGLVEVQFADARVTARLERAANGGWNMRAGLLVGRVPIGTLLQQAMRNGACKGSTIYAALKPLACDARDLPLKPGDDGADVSCEALSAGFAFSAIPARAAARSETRKDRPACKLEDDDCR